MVSFFSRFPRHYAEASLKLGVRQITPSAEPSFPRHYAEASLKPLGWEPVKDQLESFSSALRRGFIEAVAEAKVARTGIQVFLSITPRLH